MRKPRHVAVTSVSALFQFAHTRHRQRNGDSVAEQDTLPPGSMHGNGVNDSFRLLPVTGPRRHLRISCSGQCFCG